MREAFLRLWLPAGQDADHVVGLIALDADGAVVKVGLGLLVALPDGAKLQLTDGLLRCVTKTPLERHSESLLRACKM